MCCCFRLHRHQIHLISYGLVSCGLITTGLVFTVFAIFYKDSQIGKIWLAGPTTMVVGLVLAGKVVIDWGPAMLHAREGSIDSRLMDQFQMNVPPSRYPEPLRHPQMRVEHEPKCNGSTGNIVFVPPGPYAANNNHGLNHQTLPRRSHPLEAARSSVPYLHTPDQCLIYSQYNSSLNNIPINHGHDRRRSSMSRHTNHLARQSPRTSHSNHSNSADQSIALTDTCECSQYGTMRRIEPPFQGESFVLNERSYLI